MSVTTNGITPFDPETARRTIVELESLLVRSCQRLEALGYTRLMPRELRAWWEHRQTSDTELHRAADRARRNGRRARRDRLNRRTGYRW